MRIKLLRIFSALSALMIAEGCGVADEEFTILDAASAYEMHREVFASIREKYPGPFTEFTRVPPRNPADETREGEAFIRQLRKEVPIEFIDFFPYDATGKDEIDVVLKRYGENDRWTVVSLVYSDIPLPSPDAVSNMALFDHCDQRALDWLELAREKKQIAVLCRLDQYWYAYQRID